MLLWDHRKLGDDPAYTGMELSAKSIVCTTLNENGNTVKKDSIENSFEKLGEFLNNFSPGDKFVMESTGFYEPLYDFIESHGFSVRLANPLKIKLIAESRMKNDDVYCFSQFWTIHEKNYDTVPAVSPPFCSLIS